MQTNKIKVKKKKRSIVRKYGEWLGLLLVAVASVLSAHTFNKLLNTEGGLLTSRTPVVKITPPELDAQFLMAQYERKVFPYSVIPGGVRSREELSANVRTDKVVTAHYADFDVSKARLVQAPSTRFMYVSYRLKNKIYWTSKKIRIPQGETLITDGTCEARTRCGNRVSATPQTPVSENEPDVESFDIPQMASMDLPQLDPLVVPGLPPVVPMGAPSDLTESPTTPGAVPPPTIASNIPPLMPWVPRYPYPPSINIPPVVIQDDPKDPDDPNNPHNPQDEPPIGAEVPEPGTMVLVFTGLAAAAAIGIRRRKQAAGSVDADADES
ncbi:MAG: PEP-CTERM sorting domain-containing protein [Acidobacteriota bacterium]|jgi:hypothetical protein|nr:PEP-CTERM sorting domain-containing protein [Acidobacteriota bacterium]